MILAHQFIACCRYQHMHGYPVNRCGLLIDHNQLESSTWRHQSPQPIMPSNASYSCCHCLSSVKPFLLCIWARDSLTRRPIGRLGAHELSQPIASDWGRKAQRKKMAGDAEKIRWKKSCCFALTNAYEMKFVIFTVLASCHSRAQTQFYVVSWLVLSSQMIKLYIIYYIWSRPDWTPVQPGSRGSIPHRFDSTSRSFVSLT